MVRTRGTLEPTDKAKTIAVPIAEALERIAAILDDTFDPGRLVRNFRVGVVEADAAYLLTALRTVLAREASGVQISCVTLERGRRRGS